MRTLVLVPFAFACSVASSSDVATSDIKPHFSATVVGDILTVSAHFTTDAEKGSLLTYVDLADGDTLTLTVEGVDIPFEEITATNTASGDEDYATYESAGAWTGSEGEVTVAFTREKGDSAPESVLPIPPDFTLDPLDATHVVNTDLAVTWSPTGDDLIDGTLSGDCVERLEVKDQADAGTWTVPAASLAPTEVCEVTARIDRHRDGTLDPAFNQDGEASGQQSRTDKTVLADAE